MNTLFAGQNSIHLGTVDSTNSYASDLLRHSMPAEGTLIYTFDQRKGRGQRGSSWESVPNRNVAFSLILYPGFLRAEEQFQLTKISSLAVADLMAEMLEGRMNVSIKWPNDIFACDKKLAGILIENGLRDTSIQSTVIGIGLNINQAEFSTTDRAASLFSLTGKEFDLMNCVERLCELLEARYLQLKARKLQELHEAYLERLYLRDQWAQYSDDEGMFRGMITGVDEKGRLLVRRESGTVSHFDLKEIRFV